MAARNVLVKDLHGVETLGAITLLATDKTGTLTQNRMSVSEIWMNSVLYGVSSSVSTEETAQRRRFALETTPNAQQLIEICALCSKCRCGFSESAISPKSTNSMPFSESNGPVSSPEAASLSSNKSSASTNNKTSNLNSVLPSQFKIFGDATEVGLFKFALECEPNLDERIIAEHPKVWEIPFTSHNKWHLTVHRYDHVDGFFMAMLKGAPERVAARCTHLLSGTLKLPWNDVAQADFEATYAQMAAQGRRVLGLASLALPGDLFPVDCAWTSSDVDALRSFLIDPVSCVSVKASNVDGKDVPPAPKGSSSSSWLGFTLVGLVGLMDPPKSGVRRAVNALRMAGIQVVMVTGDHPLTAEV